MGDGTTANRLTPVPVKGGLVIKQMSARGFHTCAKTGAGSGYCWGLNDNDQLGDGTTTTRLVPTPIIAPSPGEPEDREHLRVPSPVTGYSASAALALGSVVRAGPVAGAP